MILLFMHTFFKWGGQTVPWLSVGSQQSKQVYDYSYKNIFFETAITVKALQQINISMNHPETSSEHLLHSIQFNFP